MTVTDQANQVPLTLEEFGTVFRYVKQQVLLCGSLPWFGPTLNENQREALNVCFYQAGMSFAEFYEANRAKVQLREDVVYVA